MSGIEQGRWDEMIAAARTAMQRAYSPYSGLSVGAAVLTTDGHLFAGCNVENVSFPCGQCAEASAIGTMVSEIGEARIRAVAVVSDAPRLVWPCGNCRQKLFEFAAADTQVKTVTEYACSAPVALCELLPSAFDRLD